MSRKEPTEGGPQPTGPVTELLVQARGGDRRALREVMAVLYDELRVLAARQRRSGPAHETLDTHALVHEAFIKLVASDSGGFADRSHFFATAATAMRHLVVDYARAKASKKRGGGLRPVTAERIEIPTDGAQPETVIEIHQALDRLQQSSPELVRVVECRYFAGLTEPETADALGVSERTVRRQWTKARAWLHRELA